MALPIEAMVDVMSILAIGLAGYFFGRSRTMDDEINAMEHANEAILHAIGFHRVLERNGLADAGIEEVKEVAEEHGYEFSEREWKYNP